MNTNSEAKRILCYGDSNTWGYMPAKATRYSIDQRWTGILQKSLGEEFEVIEEGTNSRTTDLDDPKHFGKNGAEYLIPCLESHFPLDFVVLMLGTNDLKERFNRNSERVARGIQKLLTIIKKTAEDEEEKLPKIILICPPIIDESVKG